MTLEKRLWRIAKARLRRLVPDTVGEATVANASLLDESAEDLRPPPDRSPASGSRSRRNELLAILELPPGAHGDEIRTAYRELCKRYHPDRFATQPEKAATANELLREINRAYEALSEGGVQRAG